MLKTFLEHDESSNSAVTVLKRMYLLKAHVHLNNVIESLFRLAIPTEQIPHLTGDVLGGTCFHLADDIVEELVVAHGEPILAAVGRAALEDFVPNYSFRIFNFNNTRLYFIPIHLSFKEQKAHITLII